MFLALWAPAASAWAGCEASESQLPAADVTTFIRDPLRLMMLHGNKTEELASQISALARSRKAALDALKSVMATATLAQRGAMGQGIFSAIAICQSQDHYKASQIEAWSKGLTDPEFIAAFRHARYTAELRSQPNEAKPVAKLRSNAVGALASEPDQKLDAKSLDLPDPFKTPGY